MWKIGLSKGGNGVFRCWQAKMEEGKEIGGEKMGKRDGRHPKLYYLFIDLSMTTLSPAYKMPSSKPGTPAHRPQSPPLLQKPSQSQNNPTALKKQNQEAAKSTATDPFHKKPVPVPPLGCHSPTVHLPKNNGNRPSHHMLSPQLKPELELNKDRPVSGNRQEHKPRRISHRKGNLFKQIPVQNGKYSDPKESTSKKSTDNSNSTEIQKVKAQNRQMQAIIRAEQKKMSALERQIKEEQRKHEVERQIYQLNIDKLKKKVGSNEDILSKIREGSCYDGDNEEDCLSIESHKGRK